MTTAEEEPFKQELVGQAAKDDKAHPWRFCPNQVIRPLGRKR